MEHWCRYSQYQELNELVALGFPARRWSGWFRCGRVPPAGCSDGERKEECVRILPADNPARYIQFCLNFKLRHFGREP
jgi:hypothetical protein